MLRFVEEDGVWVLKSFPDLSSGDFPPENSVLVAVDFDNGARTGTLVVPTAEQVEDGVPFGPGGATTGTLVAGGFVVAPDGSPVVDSSGNPISLTQGIGADRVLTYSATVAFNFATPGEVKPEAV